MTKKGKRKASITAYILVVCMLVGMFPSAAFAQQEEIFICGKELHTHDDSCYQTEEDENKNPQKTLICEQEEHAHTEDCLAESAKVPQDSESNTNADENEEKDKNVIDDNVQNDSNNDDMDKNNSDDIKNDTKQENTEQITDNNDENADENPDAAKDPDATEENDKNTDDTKEKDDEQQIEQDPDEEEQQSEAPKKARVARAAQADETHTDPNDHVGDNPTGWTKLESSTSITDSGNYYLNGNVELSDTLTISGDVNVTLCLNGHTLTGDGNGSVISVGSGAKLTLCDCSSAKTGTITSKEIQNNNEEINGGGVRVQGIGSEFTMTGGTITGNTVTYDGGGVFVHEDAKFTMNDGKIFNNTANGNGGGVSVNGGEFTMTGGIIGGDAENNGNTANYGGGVYVNDGTFTMSNSSTIAVNVATSGGGVYIEGSGAETTLEMNGGTIEYNTSLSGGGVYVKGEQATFTMKDSTITMKDSTITNNSAGYDAGNGTIVAGDGGGVYIDGSTFNMQGGTISGNTAFISDSNTGTGCGGGVYAMAGINNSNQIVPATFNMTGGTISGNTAGVQGGGVITYASNFTMDTENGNKPTISGNEATFGGGVAVISEGNEKATFNMTGGTIGGTGNGNTAINGAGVYVDAGTFEMTDGNIIGNTANYDTNSDGTYIGGGLGGGVAVSEGTFTISGSNNPTISGNNAFDGAGVFAMQSDFTMESGKISGNTADDSAAGVYCSGTDFTMSGGSITGNEAAAEAGGVLMIDGTFKVSNGATITGNTSTLDSEVPDSNVYLLDGQTITVDGTLKGTEQIGVTTEVIPTEQVPVDVTATTAEGNATYFVSDNPAYETLFDADTSKVVLGKAKGFTITFNLNYAGAPTATKQKVDPNATATAPDPAPERTGFTFAGWYVDEACTTAYDFATPVTESITLYAKWDVKAATVTVTFNVNGGTPEITAQEIEQSGKATKPADPTKDGFTFAGWYSDEALTTEYNFNDPVTADLTLYAKWEAVEMVTITFNSKGGSTIAPMKVEKGSILTSLPTLTMPPFTFGGWCTDNACKNPFDINTPIDADITLYAKWSIGSVSSPLKASASGKVVYLDGSPVKGATVTVSNLMTGAVEATTTTDSNGKYSFANLVAIPYRIAATITINGEEKTTGFQRISLKLGENSLADLQFLVNAAVVKVETPSSSANAIINIKNMTVKGLDKVLERETTPNTVTQITLTVEDPEPVIAERLEVAAILASRTKLPNYITDQNSKRSSTLEAEERSKSESETEPVKGRLRIPSNITDLNSPNRPTVRDDRVASLKLSGEKVTAPAGAISQAISQKMNSMNPPVETVIPFPDGDKGLEMQKELEEQRASFNIVKTRADELANSPNKVPVKLLEQIERANSARPRTLAAYDLAVAAEYDETLRPDTFWIDDDGIHICMQDMGYYSIVYTEYEVVENASQSSTRTGRTGTWVKEDDKTEPKEPDVTQNTPDVPQNNQNTQQNTPITYANCPKDSRCPLSQFADLKQNEWYHDGVHYCLENGLMAGTGTTSFEPSTKATRAMVVAILWRLENSPVVGTTTSFEDVAEGAYYKDAVCWAVSEGIISGYDEKTFAPDQDITREQMAAILYRYAQYKGIDVTTDSALNFADTNEISTYAADAMRWACGVGIINGTSSTTLSPKSGATRAQVAQMLKMYINQ